MVTVRGNSTVTVKNCSFLDNHIRPEDSHYLINRADGTKEEVLMMSEQGAVIQTLLSGVQNATWFGQQMDNDCISGCGDMTCEWGCGDSVGKVQTSSSKPLYPRVLQIRYPRVLQIQNMYIQQLSPACSLDPKSY